MFGFGHLDGGSIQRSNIENPGKSFNEDKLLVDTRQLKIHTATEM